MSDACDKSSLSRRDKPQTLEGIEPQQNLWNTSCNAFTAHSYSNCVTSGSSISSCAFSKPCSSSQTVTASTVVTSSTSNSTSTSTSTSSPCSCSSASASASSSSISFCSASSSFAPSHHRLRARTNTSGSDVAPSAREHACDDVASRSAGAAAVTAADSGNDEFNKESKESRSSRRQSLNFEDISPSAQSGGKSALAGRPLRYPSGCGSTTRKCVLTLDGYSYVIVASTPENRSTRDESTGSSGTIGGGCASAAVLPTSGTTNTAERRTPNAFGNIFCSSGNTAKERSSQSCSPTFSNNRVTGFEISSKSGENGNCHATKIVGANLSHEQSINGQIATHGSLTIVRRSNSRKSFTQADVQQTILLSPNLASSITTASATATKTITTLNTSLEKVATNTSEVAANALASTTSKTVFANNNQQKYPCSSNDLAATEESAPLLTTIYCSYTTSNAVSVCSSESTALRMQTGTSTTNTTTTISSINIDSNSSDITTVETTSPITPSIENAPSYVEPPGMGVVKEEERGRDCAHGGGNGAENAPPSTPPTVMSVDLATENLPAVDTPDACDKAAVRLRCLLRLLNAGEISTEILQKNIHYAARVLEAVFLDETKSFPLNKSNLRRNLSSSVDCEDQANGSSGNNLIRCNGNCKPPNSSQNTQHSQENNHCCSNSSNLQRNINENSSLQKHLNNFSSHNQPTSIESRTKGVSLAPQTHSGPTGPPDKGVPAATDLESKQNVDDNETDANAKSTSTYQTASESKGCVDVARGKGGDGNSSIGTSSSNSNKATVQRQRRLRTPVWARSMSTNKTYSFQV